MSGGQTPRFPPVLETKNLLLRGIREEDAKSIFEYASNPKVSLYTRWEPHRTLDDTVKFIRATVIPNYEKRVPDPLGIALLPSPDRLIGMVGCFWVSQDDRTMELEYALAEPYWGKGLIVEASAAMLDFVFANHAVERVQARCMTQNILSARVMEKLGMTHEGTLRSCLYQRGQFWDMHVYSVLSAEHRAGSQAGQNAPARDE